MIIDKKIIGSLNKCYSLTLLTIKEKKYLACAAEKQDPCFLFTQSGTLVKTLWDEPGGVMTMEQYPGNNFVLLATQKFYSPNDSAEAKIVYYTMNDKSLECHVLCELPFVHRFGVLKRGNHKYLIACTLKSGHSFKNDWTCPGQVWVAELPDDLSCFNENNQLEMKVLMNGLTHNHGFFKSTENDYDFAVVGSDLGVHKITPPADGEDWKVEELISEPTSDMVLVDLDGDGNKELLTISPFHGDEVKIYKEKNNKMNEIYFYPEKLPFLHAIYTFCLKGKNVVVIGNREGNRDLLLFYYDDKEREYKFCSLDKGAGAANVMYFNDEGHDKLLAANRETNEIAIYSFDEIGEW